MIERIVEDFGPDLNPAMCLEGSAKDAEHDGRGNASAAQKINHGERVREAGVANRKMAASAQEDLRMLARCGGIALIATRPQPVKRGGKTRSAKHPRNLQ